MATDSIRAAQKVFLSSPYFAVVGASKDQRKWGTKVLKWYQDRQYKVTPVHPKEAELEGIPTVASITDLAHPKETSVSIITPPKLTLSILELAKQVSIPALWLQPGAEDAAVIEYIKKEGLSDRVIYGGTCILVEGDGIKQTILFPILGKNGVYDSLLRLSSGAFTLDTNNTPFVSAAWYAGWHYNDIPLANVSWSKYTHMSYAFATTTPNAPFVALDPSDSPKLTNFVAQAHQNGVKATLAIGGWTSSRWFSLGVGSATNRTKFATAVAQLISTYKLDGVDFDWEFPTSAGIGCNAFSPNDTDNYLAFLRELRKSSSGSNAIISLAVSTKPFNDSSGQAADLSEFSKVIDYIEIMDYDIKSSPLVGAGPSSPLNDTCAPSGARSGSAVSAIEAWVGAGIPTNQIVLGVAGYGRSFAVTPSNAFLDAEAKTLASYPRYDPESLRAGDKWDGGWGIDVCGNVQSPGGTYNYWGLIDRGILDQNGTVRDGISYRYDNCSQTPFAYDPDAQLLISFENPTSLKVKGQFITASGLKGFAMWEVGSDNHDVLLDAMISGLNSDVTSIENTPSTKNSGSRDIQQIQWMSIFGIVVVLCVLS